MKVLPGLEQWARYAMGVLGIEGMTRVVADDGRRGSAVENEVHKPSPSLRKCTTAQARTMHFEVFQKVGCIHLQRGFSACELPVLVLVLELILALVLVLSLVHIVYMIRLHFSAARRVNSLHILYVRVVTYIGIYVQYLQESTAATSMFPARQGQSATRSGICPSPMYT
jgi:hypothetical protein